MATETGGREIVNLEAVRISFPLYQGGRVRRKAGAVSWNCRQDRPRRSAINLGRGAARCLLPRFMLEIARR